MIITKEVVVSWSNLNFEHYIEKGYKFNKYGEKFLVRVEDLPNQSNCYVKAKCLYCYRIFNRKYSNIFESIKSSTVGRWACKECASVKSKEEEVLAQSKGLLTPDDRGYWNYIENIKSELEQYLETHENLDHVHINHKKLYNNARRKGFDLKEIAISMGYDWETMTNKLPINYYKNFDNIKAKIVEFIADNDRFPNMQDFLRTLKIDGRSISFHGGIDAIKKENGLPR